MRRHNGFSLIELLIAVAIILIIAAIAIPNFLRVRVSAQESAAAYHLKTLNTAETTYSTTYPTCGFVGMAPLGGDGSGPAASGILDNVFPTRGGYFFAITPTGTPGSCGVSPSGDGYTILATPTATLSFPKHFYTDATLVIRYKLGGDAGPTDPPIQ